MAESVFIRIKRIISGSIEDAVDNMETKGGSIVMKEAIREVDRVIDEVKSNRNDATSKRLQALRQKKMYQEKIEELSEKALFVMEQGREDLAEATIHRQMRFEEQLNSLDKIEEKAGEEERELEEALASLEMRKASMEEELEHFIEAREEAGVMDDNSSVKHAQSLDQQVERSENAFSRAMKGAGGSNWKEDAKQSHQIAEIEVMQRNDEIQQRLNALREKKSA